jgi:hypothetical protein
MEIGARFQNMKKEDVEKQLGDYCREAVDRQLGEYAKMSDEASAS